MSSLPTFSFFSSQVASAVVKDAEENQVDMITFLAVIQKCNISYVPLTWGPGLVELGKGATGLVSQSIPSIAMAFAFKRVREPKGLKHSSFFLPLVTEIAILSQPRIQEHPNVVNLEGVCWEVSREGDVLPVLVFEKATWDLDQFMSSEEGLNMSLGERLQISTDIGNAILALHTYGVIHGDIKPGNVLVFKNGNRTTVKVADFGYSTIVAGDTGTVHSVHLPKSRPWNTPEHHFGSFTIIDAQKADVYSFGLLCLWIMFGKRFPAASSKKPAVTVESISFTLPSERHELSAIEKLRDQDKLIDTVHRLVQETPGLEREAAASLKQFFSLALTRKCQDRIADLGTLVPLLRPQRVPFPAAREPRMISTLQGILDPADASFRLAGSLIDFVRTDYRVRIHIRLCLEDRYSRTKTSTIAFQIALCYKIGFGVSSNEVMCNMWLELSSRSLTEIEDETTAIMAERRRPNAKLDDLLKARLVSKVNFVAEYIILGPEKLQEARDVYERELYDMEKHFGKNHSILEPLRRVMERLLVELGEYSEAEAMNIKIIERKKNMLGEEHPDTLNSISYLVSTYGDQGRWTEAEELGLQELKLSKKVHGQDHPETLCSMSTLSTIYWQQGRWTEAEDLDLQTLELRKKVLGYEHPDTLNSLNSLGIMYTTQGRWPEAQNLQAQAIDLSKKIFGQEHLRTLNSMASLATTYSEQGRWCEAEELEVQVLKIRKKVLGLTHPDTFTSMVNLASTYADQGRLPEAEELEQQAMELRKKVLGPEHPDTLTSMKNLSLTYWEMGRLTEAERLQAQAMETTTNLFGLEHPDTLRSMANLAVIYSDQGRSTDAEKLEQQVVDLRKRLFGQEHRTTLISMANLASTYSDQGRWDEAEALELQVMKIRQKVLGREHPDTMNSMVNLASTYSDQGRTSEAEELELQAMEIMKVVLGQEHPDTLRIMGNIASTYRDQGRWAEAAELETQVIKTKKKVLGQDHPKTLTSMGNLASTYSEQGRWAEAEALEVQVVEMRKKVLGKEHPETLISMANLAFTYKSQARVDDAIALLASVCTLESRTFGEDDYRAKSSRRYLAEWAKESGRTNSNSDDSGSINAVSS